MRNIGYIMRQIADRKVWIGNAGDLRDPSELFTAGIEAVVELADNEAMAVLPRELIRLRFPLADGGTNPDWLVRLAVNSVSELLRAPVPTIVCCSNGLSRSVCVVAGAVALVQGRAFKDSLVTVANAGTADVSPGVFKQFQMVLQQ